MAKCHAKETGLSEVQGRIGKGLVMKSYVLSKALEDRISRLRFAAGTKQAMAASRVSLVEARIAGADPREILSRGYVLVTGRDNRILKSTSRVRIGDRIGVRFSDGHLRATVNEVACDEAPGRKVSTARKSASE